MGLVLAVYRMTSTFPRSEVYGLANQMRRAAVSIPSNIGEGHALKQPQAYVRYLAIANGSLAELETQLEIADHLGYLTPAGKQAIPQADEVSRKLAGLRKSLQP